MEAYEIFDFVRVASELGCIVYLLGTAGAYRDFPLINYQPTVVVGYLIKRVGDYVAVLIGDYNTSFENGVFRRSCLGLRAVDDQINLVSLKEIVCSVGTLSLVYKRGTVVNLPSACGYNRELALGYLKSTELILDIVSVEYGLSVAINDIKFDRVLRRSNVRLCSGNSYEDVVAGEELASYEAIRMLAVSQFGSVVFLLCASRGDLYHRAGLNSKGSVNESYLVYLGNVVTVGIVQFYAFGDYNVWRLTYLGLRTESFCINEMSFKKLAVVLDLCRGYGSSVVRLDRASCNNAELSLGYLKCSANKLNGVFIGDVVSFAVNYLNA